MSATMVSGSPSLSSPSSASAASAPIVRKISFAEYRARGPIKPRTAGSAVAKESNTTTTTTAARVSRSPSSSSSAARLPVNRKITFAEYRARGTVGPRTPGSAVSKESTTTTTTTTTTVAPPPSPPVSFSLSPILLPASSPPASPSPAPLRLPPVDVRKDASFTTAVLTRNTKVPGNPLETRNVRVVNPLVRRRPKPKSAATPASPPATRSPSPVAARQSTPSDDEFDYLFNEPPSKAAVRAAKEARREAALARSSKITTGAIARAGNNPMANTRARLNRIDKSARNSAKVFRGGAGGGRKSKIRSLAGSSGRWIDPETHSEASSAQLEAMQQQQQQQQQQQRELTPLEAEVAARRAAEMEQYRRNVDKLLAEAPRNSGGCVGVLGDSRMSTVGFGNDLRERRPEENPMWTTNAAVLHGQGGLRY